jgi:hypothetical protein
LAACRPERFHGYIALRRVAFNAGPEAALSPTLGWLHALVFTIGKKQRRRPGQRLRGARDR